MYRLQTESQWEHCDSLADNDSWRCSVLTEKTKRKLPGSLWCTVQPLTSPLLPPISATMKMRQNSHDQENYTLPLKERKRKKRKKNTCHTKHPFTIFISYQFFNLSQTLTFQYAALKNRAVLDYHCMYQCCQGWTVWKTNFLTGCWFFSPFSTVHVRLCYTDHSLVKVLTSPVLCTVLSHDTTVFLDCVLKPNFLPFNY